MKNVFNIYYYNLYQAPSHFTYLRLLLTYLPSLRTIPLPSHQSTPRFLSVYILIILYT